ncbi:hypothetical protein CEUSTIGMA_g2876.t1 [Chlamydomonas eustigma]|uniref:Fibronectin type-III domain-containing protein n=1 Tax=Chlamydomonas eustigma TaxID=1157962 RepID=A0A250WXT4_9CHLO|nr:hypothetical protein CEUSTIGMA_g2876.t1 [Chlamydomonas eustigma]|eukprot:GAX75432.1 hypothetical protein CEUSTIGMA_g2876.t1 [Chlamydomonas eustigma]
MSIYRKLKKNVASFLDDVQLVLRYLWVSFTAYIFNLTLPITRRLLSRNPYPPTAVVQDIRANRIRFNICSNLSSPFNVEEFELEWRPHRSYDDPSWTSLGFNDLPQRTVIRLQPDCQYLFRVRARNWRGVSGWCPVIEAKTRQEPKDGGGCGPRYTWSQSPVDVTVSFELPLGTSKKDVQITLSQNCRSLSVVVKKPANYPGPWDEVLLQGDLYGRVSSFANGSVWEMVKEGGSVTLNITLEKAVRSQAPKFDYWRSVQPGHPELEIDTHLIVVERGGGGDNGAGMHMIQPGKMDPEQLRAMSLGSYVN